MFAELEQDNLAQVVADNNIVIVQYGAGWCGNCRLVKPKFKKLAAEYEGQAEFLYVDAEKLVESRKLANVPNLPTFAVFKGGENVGQVTASKIDAVKELINEAAGI